MVKKIFELLVTVCFVVLIIGVYQYRRPLPIIEAAVTLEKPQLPKPAEQLWPNYGQSAIGAVDYGLLASHGIQQPVPMASIAKVVTALAVLKDKPLAKGETGPLITINSDDVATYNDYYARGGAVAKVTLGGQISQYQALQAMLIPSANNYADTLARWAFGSVDNYLVAANKLVAELGMTNTKITSANGFSADTVSSSEDLIKLGLSALSNEVIAEIVKQPTANIPLAGTINNTNWLLGSDGVIGIKTGSTNEAGGCYLFASNRSINGQPLTLIGAIMGAADRNAAIADSRILLGYIDSTFEQITLVKKNGVLGHYQMPWGAKSDIVLAQDLSILAWKGGSLEFNQTLSPATIPSQAGEQVGELILSQGEQTKKVPVILKDNLAAPSLKWRIFR